MEELIVYFILAMVLIIIMILAIIGFMLLSRWLSDAQDAASEARAAARTRSLIEQAIALDYGRDLVANQEMSKVHDFAREHHVGMEALAEPRTPPAPKFKEYK